MPLTDEQIKDSSAYLDARSYGFDEQALRHVLNEAYRLGMLRAAEVCDSQYRDDPTDSAIDNAAAAIRAEAGQ